MMRIYRLALFIGIYLIMFSSPANATDGIVCSGTVTELTVKGGSSGGVVVLRLSGMNTKVTICSLDQTVGTHDPVSPNQCKATYTNLLTAYMLGKTISNLYFDNVVTGTTCSDFATYELATARGVKLD